MSDKVNSDYSNKPVSNYNSNTYAKAGNYNEIPDAILSFANSASEPVEVEKGSGNQKRRYILGSRNGDVRTIPETSVMVSGGRIINFGGYAFALPDNQGTHYSNTTDNYIGDSRQAKRGDCYFLAEINAIRNTKEGQRVLTQNLKKNSDGSYTVKLPGAIKIRKQYEAKGLSCQVTGTYHISKAALEKAGGSKFYSKGDLEVVALELAMEAYRAEMYLTNKANKTNTGFATAEGAINTQRIRESGNMLNGGYTHDAGFLLTGQKSDAFYATKKRYNSVKPYKDGEYGYITREQMAQRTDADISMYKRGGLGISELSHLTQNEQAINSMLNKYEDKEGQYALTFGVRVA